MNCYVDDKEVFVLINLFSLVRSESVLIPLRLRKLALFPLAERQCQILFCFLLRYRFEFLPLSHHLHYSFYVLVVKSYSFLPNSLSLALFCFQHHHSFDIVYYVPLRQRSRVFRYRQIPTSFLCYVILLFHLSFHLSLILR